MKKILFICGLVLVFAGFTSAQSTTITIENKVASVNEEISVPIDVTGFLNVGAISFKIKYDPAVLEFQGVENFPQTGFLSNPVNGIINFSWLSNDVQINITNGKLLDLKFKKIAGGVANLQFQLPQSKIYNSAAVLIPATYNNGSVTPTQSEVIKVDIGEVQAAGAEVTVPIDVTNFNNIGAITLNIQFDPAVATFTGVENAPANMQANATGNLITLSWSNATPINLGNSTLVNLKFDYSGGTTDLAFDDNTCQIVDGDLNVLTGIDYVDGKINANPETQISVVINSVTANGAEVTVPVAVTNFNNIGAITLSIQFNNTVATFTGIENNPANMQANAVGNTINISWSSATALNLGDANLVNLKFSYLGGSTDLDFNTANCQLVDGSLNILPFVVYGDGAILANPATQIKIELGQVEASGAEVTIPLNVTNFNNIGAITLNITFDQAVAAFTGIENGPANMQANAVGNTITISWSSATALNLGDTTLVNLKFAYVGGETDLIFNSANCQIIDGNLNVIAGINYVDGKILANPLTQITIKLETVEATGNSVSVPLTVQNFNNIGAITLNIQFDPAVAVFDGVEGAPANMQANAVGNTITLSWSSATALNLGNDTLATLNFTYNEGQTSLTFDQTSCQIVDGNLSVITGINYVDGAITAVGFPIVTIPDIVTTSGDVLVPIQVQNFNNIGSFTLNIQYNNVNLVYQGIEDAPANTQVGVNNGVISLSWANTTALPVADTLLNIRFTYGGPSDLDFIVSQCQLTTPEADVIAYVEYNNGSVSGNQAPVFTTEMPDTMISEGELFEFDYDATDANGTTLEFILAKGPVGSKIDSLTGLFSWTPSFTSVGMYNVTVIVTDGVLSDTTNSVILVNDVNRAPVFTKILPDTLINRGDPFSFQYEAEDPDGDALRYKLLGIPSSGVSISATTGLLQWTPDTVQAGDHTIIVEVSDGSLTDTATTQRLTVNVTIVDNRIPDAYELMQNFPNPFNPTTKIRFGIPEEARVTLKIYNLLGQEVQSLVDEYKPAGFYAVDFNAGKLPSGIYLYKVQANKFTSVKKMLLIK